MRSLKRYIIILLPGLLVITFICCREKSANGAQNNSERQVAQDTIIITAVGDMMLGSAFPSKAGLPPDDAINSFEQVQQYLTGDIVFGNLEGVLLNNGTSSKCKGASVNSCYAFRMPERYGMIFKNAGFNVLSIANNHVGDFDGKGRVRTAAVLDSLGIAYAGQMNKPYHLFEKNGVKYAFCAFAPNENTVDIRKIEEAKKLVASLNEQADVVVVSFHGGGEGAPFEHVTRKTEFYYKEDRGNVYAFAHAVVDAGADIVLGHGPHVTRAVEVYKGKFIAYSLGNFCTYGMFSLKGANGIAPLLTVRTDRAGNFIDADVISVKQDKVNRLQVDSLQQAFEKIKTLTETDFPDHELDFSVPGKIGKKG
ncbi:MAG: CapA family protein [Chitinophagaceae bacterium]|nr:MAG: CapA family protein [Chitinophagaceae bacterium]